MLAGSAVRALRISSGKNSLILLSTTNVNDSVRNAHQKHKTVKNQDRLAAVSNNSKLDFDLNQTLNKLKQLSVKINTNLLDVDTLRRLDRSSSEFLASLMKNLQDYGFKPVLEETLKNHDDWSALERRENLERTCDLFRSFSLKPEIYSLMLARHPALWHVTKSHLTARFADLTFFFTRTHLDRLLPRSPHVLTSSFDSFRYKYNYVFALMGFEQREMSSTRLFDCELEFIRRRHLFLERALLYDRPNKKGITRVENPKLAHILEPRLDEFLRLCTRDLLTEDDYRVFCDYLSQEKFDNELLGSRIDSLLKKQIIADIRVQKREEYEDY